jgi:membrane fusion protein (multidrug efflux system)
MKRLKLVACILLGASVAWSQELVAVVSKPLSRTIELPGEFAPFQSVEIHSKLRGFVERVLVDRGSVVKKGQLLAEITAPEMTAQMAEAESKVQAAESDRLQIEAQLVAALSTADRLKKASETPGAISANELIQAQTAVDAAQALVQSKRQVVRAAQAAAQAQKDLAAYLHVSAPFDGVVTERMVHPGALVGPSADPVLLVIQEVSRLRLVVPLPEEDIAGIVQGAKVEFKVPAYPGRTYSGTVARIAHTVDPKTRSMAIELDVINRDGSLAPGMYPAVKWPVRRSRASLMVPKTAIVTTSERTFVIRNREGKAEWVNVVKGAADGDLIEVAGALQAGERVVQRATDEIRDGAALQSAAK